MPAEKSFLSLVRNRASVIMNMTNYHLSLDWVRAYSLDQLSACCERMAEYLSGESIADKTLQCELIQNPAFAAYYAKLMTLLPEEPETAGTQLSKAWAVPISCAARRQTGLPPCLLPLWFGTSGPGEPEIPPEHYGLSGG